MNSKLVLLAICGCLCYSSCKKGTNSTQKTDPMPTSTAKKGATLSADGTDTYTLINKVLSGGGDVLETPDCAHAAASPHITQVYDNFLKKQVFAFKIHVTPDNDKCNGKTDRQRNEIKTYEKSPDSLKGALNETVEYNWKFKIDADFQPSPNFTHLHQIKPADGDDELPIITVSARYKSSGNQMEIIHTGGTGKNTSEKYLASIPLSDFKGQWVEVTERVTYSYSGKYEISIKRLSDNKQLLTLKVDDIDMWRDATTFCRPKWGVYRSLLSPTYLRDETVCFNDFKITEIK